MNTPNPNLDGTMFPGATLHDAVLADWDTTRDEAIADGCDDLLVAVLTETLDAHRTVLDYTHPTGATYTYDPDNSVDDEQFVNLMCNAQTRTNIAAARARTGAPDLGTAYRVRVVPA